MSNMFIAINEIGPDGVPFNEPVTLPPARDGAVEGMTLLAAKLTGRALLAGGGVEFSAALDACVRLECGRCLEPFETRIRRDFCLTLVADAAEFGAGEAEVREDDASLFYATEGRVSLAEIAAEQIYLNLPLKPVCDEDCKGLCPTCGVNRNRIECGCRSEEIDPRLVPLLEFKKRTGGA